MTQIDEAVSQPVTKKRGRKPKGDRPMTSAERAKASRFRRMYTGDDYSGKQVSVMLSAPAHRALDNLVIAYNDKSQKEIIDIAILTLLQLLKSQQVTE